MDRGDGKPMLMVMNGYVIIMMGSITIVISITCIRANYNVMCTCLVMEVFGWLGVVLAQK